MSHVNSVFHYQRESGVLSQFLQRSVDLMPWWLRNSLRRIPIVAGLQRWFFAKFLSGREFVHRISAGPAKGLVYPVSLPQDKLLWAGTWESEFTSKLVPLIPPGAVCYDIGGHRGFLAGVMAMSGASEVHCFEPNPENAAQIGKVIELNPDRKMTLHQCAVGATDTTAEFVIMPQSSMGKLNDSSFQSDQKTGTRIKVDVRSLDSILARNGLKPPHIMKIDVEGAEVDVLQGASTLIQQYHPKMCIEFHSRALLDACIKILNAAGYRIELLEYASASDVPADGVGHLIATVG
jgi:FkbM family methyltransferase